MSTHKPHRIFVFGATGTIGRATVRVLVAQGHEVICFVRRGTSAIHPDLTGAEIRLGDVCDLASVKEHGLRNEPFDTIVSALASRTGVSRDAWAIDYRAHSQALTLAQQGGIRQFVLLSALCVQKPILPFQRAKLAFEQELMASGLTYSIVRPTAFFKSLSGQIERIKAGKPFLFFGDGCLTACKPISDHDLAHFIATCLYDTSKHNAILPIGGPGQPITPRDQGKMIFAALGRVPRFRSVPVSLLKTIHATLSGLGRLSTRFADKAELAAIGLYYGTESMLVFNADTGQYDANATPSTGHETLQSYYERLIRNEIQDDRGEHAVF